MVTLYNFTSERNRLVTARRLRLLGVLSRVRGVGAAESVQGLRLHGDDLAGKTGLEFFSRLD